MRRALLLAWLLVVAGSAPAHAQVFFASNPKPPFKVGPVYVRALISPALGDVTVNVFFGLDLPSEIDTSAIEQDLYLIWPFDIAGDPKLGPPDPALVKQVAELGFSPMNDGRLPMTARNLYARAADGRSTRETIPGGAPFVTFIRTTGGPMGISAPAALIRIPWNPRMANRLFMMDLTLVTKGLIKPKPATWLEEALWGHRYRVTISWSDVQSRGLFRIYFARRDRVLHLSEDPSRLVVNFDHADRLKIDEMVPNTARRELSETLDNTDVVSAFLDPSAGLRPQTLAVQFGYFSGLQSWAPVLIPVLFFALGNLAGPVIRSVIERVGRTLTARVEIGPTDPEKPGRESGVVVRRDQLARIVPRETTYDEVVRVCGANYEEHEQLAAPDRRTLIYRGRVIVPHRHRTFGWLSTIDGWEAEHHEVTIELERNVVTDVQARLRRTRVDEPDQA
jgi:hypothetical protein